MQYCISPRGHEQDALLRTGEQEAAVSVWTRDADHVCCFHVLLNCLQHLLRVTLTLSRPTDHECNWETTRHHISFQLPLLDCIELSGRLRLHVRVRLHVQHMVLCSCSVLSVYDPVLSNKPHKIFCKST